jgi:MoaA/NifB/PqqE/SkfB family radical SAM enzyme
MEMKKNFLQNDYTYTFRKEYFGFTKYNHDLLTHDFINDLPKQNIDKSSFVDLGSHKCINDGLLVAPIRVYIETTLRCNLTCNYCFNNKNKIELSTKDLKRAIRIIKNNGVLDVRFTGGEFTLRKDFIEILQFSKDIGLSISFNTNGVYSPELNKELIKIVPNQVTFSLDGNKSYHDCIKGSGSFEQLYYNIKTLYNNDINTRFNTVLTKENANQISDILDIAKNVSNEINFFGLRIIGNSPADSQYKLLSFAEFNESAKKLSKIKIKGLKIHYGHNVMKSTSINKNNYGLICGSPDFTTRFNMNSIGDIFSGGYLMHISNGLKLGNVFDSEFSIYNIWHFSSKLKKLRDFSLHYKNKCYQCKFYIDEICNGNIFEMEINKAFYGGVNPYCYYNFDNSILKNAFVL